MNIIDSLPLMTAIDLVIIGCAAIAIGVVLRLGRRVPGIYLAGPIAVAVGFGMIAAFFALDLATMWVLPGFVGAERSHAWMMDLHMNWSWIVMLAVSFALTAGLVRTSHGLIRAQRKLREQDALHQSVIEEQSEYIVRWRPDGTRTFVNDAYCRYRHAKAEELVGENFYHLIAPADRERVFRKLDYLTPEQPTFTDSHRSVAPDGSMRWQEWSDRGIFDDAGRLIEVQSVGRDITDRRSIELELESREQQYEAIFRAAANGITLRRLADGKLLKVNPAMAEMFGYSIEEFKALELSDYIHEESLSLYSEMMAALGRGERFPFEARGLHRAGHELELEGFFVPFVFAGEEQILGLTLDVTQRNRALAGLQESEGRFRALFEAAPDAIVVTGIQGEVLDLNAAACRLRGRSREELVGLHFSELVGEGEREAAIARYERVRDGETIQVEGVTRRSDGTKTPVGIRANRFDYSGQPALLYCVTDLTEQRQLEEQLRQSQKMEAVGQLAGGVAHDFNNLLTAILGYAELVEGALSVDRKVMKDVLEIRRAGEKASGLVGQLLAFSRQQVLAPRVLDLNEALGGMVELCRRTIGDDIALSTRFGGEPALVRADQSQLEQVILNLAINARDAMPAGGELIFEARCLTLDRHEVSHGIPVMPGDYVGLTVSDTGCGMTKEVSRRVFEPFFTTKRPGEGTGLGLSMVYGLVKQSEGLIWVESEVDVGTTFRILLPRVEGEVEALRESGRVAPIVAAARTILLVDDHAAVRRVAERGLEEQGHRVVSAESGEEALELFREHRRGFDLLLVDFVLPGMNGLDLAKEVLADWPETRVILMSGYSGKAGSSLAVDHPEIHFLRKPFNRRGLLQAVAEVLRQSSGASPGSHSESKAN